MSVQDLTILGCSSQQPTRLRNHGAYLLRWNGEGFLFDPGEGTQRQFIFANISPTVVSRIFISHFHGDHCLGLGSMLMRLNLDKIQHEVHCYYPASGKIYFDRLRYGTIYHNRIKVIEHAIDKDGVVHDDGQFCIEAYSLDHGIDNVGYRIKEKDSIKFDKDKLAHYKIFGEKVKELEKNKVIQVDGKTISLDMVSRLRVGDVFAVIMDTRFCENTLKIAKEAKMLLCESTYLEEHKDLALDHMHLTARQAAVIAKKSNVQNLILTHFSARYRHLEAFKEEAKRVFPSVQVADDFKCFPFPRN